jgi:hypothetical protein
MKICASALRALVMDRPNREVALQVSERLRYLRVAGAEARRFNTYREQKGLPLLAFSN